ncbi:MAG TPA: TIGR02147 family protein [Chitinispirillaceae bacterium]|nr:TIGR02147 family protein [Chitinispirillaceae bacterium]
MTDIFTYTDYRKFIKDYCEEQRKEKPFFSYRYIAQKADLKSTGFISWVVAGKRTMSLKLAHKICIIFKLGKRETDYLLLLVNHNQSNSAAERQHYLDRMLAFRSTRTEIVHRDNDLYYSKWYYAAIRELVAISRITNEQDIASLLRPSITRSEAKDALELLCRLDLIRKNSAGFYERSASAIRAGTDVDRALIHGYQIASMQLGQSSLCRFDKDERDISTLTVSCNAADFQRIRDSIAKLREEITEIVCESKNANQVFQINMQLFPLSKKMEGQTE